MMHTAKQELFGKTIDGKDVHMVHLQNHQGLAASITTYGARLVKLFFEDVPVIVGFDTLEEFFKPKKAYHGATVGRYANRIREGRFSLNGKEYYLAANNHPNHLHGGTSGFHSQVWALTHHTENSATLQYVSKDGEEGYPGNVQVTVMYTLTEQNELLLQYEAATDAPTPFNITNHAYFNLNGGGTILNHRLQIHADRFTPVDTTLIPTGELRSVEGTAFDFRALKTIGEHIDKDEEQIRIGNGYDHNFVLNKEGENQLSFAAKAIGDKTGITMETFTSEPGVQLFSGNFAFDDQPETYRASFCLETQHFPDSPNQPQFPKTILEAGQTFTSKTMYKFYR